MHLIWESAPYSEGSLLVLLALADWADDDGIAWPSISALATKARLKPRQTQYIIRKIQQDGFLSIDEGGGRGNQHRYQINLTKLKGAENAPFISVKGAVDDIERVHSATQRVQSTTEKVHSTAPDPLEDPPENQKTPLPPEGERRRGNCTSRVLAVFQHWQRRLDHPHAKLDEKRTRLIQARLRDYTIDDLKAAIEGCAASPFHMGENDTGHVHDDISLICRDASHVEMFMGKFAKKPPTKDRSLDLMASMGIEWKPRYISTPEEYAALSGRPVEEVRAKWN